MEIESLACKTKGVADMDAYFCPGYKDIPGEIEICLTNKVSLSTSESEGFNLERDLNPYKRNITASITLHKNKSETSNIDSKQVPKISDASTDDQSSPDDRSWVGQKVDSILKLNRNSKKINKGRYNYLDHSASNSSLVPRVNYLSLGNENFNSFMSELTYCRSVSGVPTESRSKSFPGLEIIEVHAEASASKIFNEKAPNSTQLNPIDLTFDESSDELENDIKTSKQSETPGKYQNLISKTNKRSNSNEQASRININKTKDCSSKLHHNSRELAREEQFTEFTGVALSSADDLRNNSVQLEDEHAQQLANIDLQSNVPDKRDSKDSDKEEVRVGKEYQCSISPLIDRSKIQENQRRFKLVSGPSVVDPKVVEVVEAYLCEDLKLTRVSTEKLVIMLHQFDYKVPEFFAELLRDKESAKKRITWEKRKR